MRFIPFARESTCHDYDYLTLEECGKVYIFYKHTYVFLHMYTCSHICQLPFDTIFLPSFTNLLRSKF